MGKGYNNFMSKKAFHPGSYANQKRIHEAEAKAEAKRKHDEETLAQYQKEQELFNQKSLVSKQSKEKLSLNFMYEAPAGVEKPNEKNDNKLEWRGSSTSKSLICSAHSSMAAAATGGIKSKHTTGISLEWKRDRPVKNSAQQRKDEQQQRQQQLSNVKQELNVKTEPKVEPLNHSSGYHGSKTDNSVIHPRESKRKEEKEIEPDAKRIKKER